MQDPFDLDKYIEKAMYLPDINNERTHKNATYKQNMISLKNVVLVYGTEDTVIVPRQTAWFWFWQNNSDTELIQMQVMHIPTFLICFFFNLCRAIRNNQYTLKIGSV